ncbi:hypothetical protein N7414_27210 [Pseudomonas sp. GD04087]|uniref:hypothetical protein n=1 Tax=unclassified Pseudomonas TaxID=196821 RepID=UPI0024499DC8|nr:MULTISPECIES: hypothetical protein [unclassified Pseudomonas]MDH0292826.1 hypothetical protein [Pseudomonas sp. GD04087]MDH1047147.1 hypothetical protein [Pseudomonas sp. GD03903]MDH2003388.1 hypothetical protein [Pseudomonas sp. GD03691]
MQRSEPENGGHSTSAQEQMRPRPWLKVMLSLCVLGLLLGLMIGRLVNPAHEGPAQILGIEPSENGLVLILDAQPAVRAGHLDGALALQIDASGKAQQGQMRIGDAPARWKLQPQDNGVVLTLLSTRRLQGTWDSSEVQGRWRLNISARPE